MNEKALANFEAMAQRLIEGSFKRLFGSSAVGPLELASALMKAVEASYENGRFASHFTIELNPETYAQLQQRAPDIEQRLATLLSESVAAINVQQVPDLIILPTAAVPPQQIVVTPQRPAAAADMALTQTHKRDEAAELDAIAAVDAFLIVDGRLHIPLAKPVNNIGRQTDNDIVLSPAAVSRYHAQIRWRYGRFVLYDLSNRPGRTLVNGANITEYALEPGDVIKISQVPLIYGEGQQTRPQPPRSADDDAQTLLLP